MNRVVVTGATGFLGKHCVTALRAAGFEVHGLNRHAGCSKDVEWHEVDLLQREESRQLLEALRPSHLLHAAWFVNPEQYWTSSANVPWVQASLELVEDFAACGGRRAVLLGSCAEYDPRFPVCQETSTPIGPASMYGACKASLGLMLPYVAAAHGLDSAVWARLFYVFGPGEDQRRLVPTAIRAFLFGQRFVCANAEQVRDALLIEDAAAALVAVLESSVTGAVNIGSGVGVSLGDVLSRIAKRLGMATHLELGQSGGRHGEAAAQVADVSRLTDEVGWRPRYTLEEGLDRTIAWWRSQVPERD